MGRVFRSVWLCTAALLLAGAIPGSAASIVGRPEVVDGDGLTFGPIAIRLHGVDAPEIGQHCARANGGTWDCGGAAAERRWFTEAAWAAGQIPSPNVPVEWSPPKFEAVDPQKDAMANLLSIRSGTMTLAEVIARQGRNPDAVLAEIAATNAKLDALG